MAEHARAAGCLVGTRSSEQAQSQPIIHAHPESRDSYYPSRRRYDQLSGGLQSPAKDLSASGDSVLGFQALVVERTVEVRHRRLVHGSSILFGEPRGERSTITNAAQGSGQRSALETRASVHSTLCFLLDTCPR
jgi:hypothetical protein